MQCCDGFRQGTRKRAKGLIFASTPTIEITLPVNLKSQNTGRGNSWHNTASVRKKYERELCYDFRREPFANPTAVLYTRICGKGQRAWDNDNLAIAMKQLQDALVALDWWVDDSAKWIQCIGYRHDDTRRQDGPAVMVSVFEAQPQGSTCGNQTTYE